VSQSRNRYEADKVKARGSRKCGIIQGQNPSSHLLCQQELLLDYVLLLLSWLFNDAISIENLQCQITGLRMKNWKWSWYNRGTWRNWGTPRKTSDSRCPYRNSNQVPLQDVRLENHGLFRYWILSGCFLSYCFIWRSSQYVHTKHRWTTTRLYRVTSQNVLFSFSRVPQVQRKSFKVLFLRMNIFTNRPHFQFHSEIRGTPLGMHEILKGSL
jgi:hypothetical protein